MPPDATWEYDVGAGRRRRGLAMRFSPFPRHAIASSMTRALRAALFYFLTSSGAPIKMAIALTLASLRHFMSVISFATHESSRMQEFLRRRALPPAPGDYFAQRAPAAQDGPRFLDARSRPCRLAGGADCVDAKPNAADALPSAFSPRRRRVGYSGLCRCRDFHFHAEDGMEPEASFSIHFPICLRRQRARGPTCSPMFLSRCKPRRPLRRFSFRTAFRREAALAAASARRLPFSSAIFFLAIERRVNMKLGVARRRVNFIGGGAGRL